MAELRLKIHTSADGFIGRPDGDVDFIFPSMKGEDMSAWEVGILRDCDLHLMGRVLYGSLLAGLGRTPCPADERDPEGRAVEHTDLGRVGR